MTEQGILELPGIGPTLLKRLEHRLGGRDGVVEALERGDVVALSSVNGVSRQRAVRLVQVHRGEASDWLATENAQDLAREAIAPFLDRAITRMGKASLETLAPTTDAERLTARLEQARTWLDRLSEVDLDPVRAALRDVDHPSQPRPKPERGVTLLVEEDLLSTIQEADLDRWVEVGLEADSVAGESLVLAATMGEIPRGALHVPPGEPHEMVPWRALAWAQANRDLLQALSSLAPTIAGVDDHASPVLEALDQGVPDRDVDLEGVATECLEQANAEIEQEMEQLTVSGKDVLQVLQGGSSTKVEEVVAQAVSRARKRFQAETGLTASPFTHDYPVEMAPEEVARLERQLEADQALDRFRAAQRVARAVHAHREGVQAMVQAAVELDRWQAACVAADELGLGLPELGDELVVQGALHLSLAGEGDPVDYHARQGVALLTGANSGGKTTLLETLGQVAYLAHLGLPVPARAATVPVLDGLAYYARPRQLGAGAFEGFLRTIEAVLLESDDVLVLADELEAMTELEAAAAILAEVAARLDARGCPAVLVTHLAPFILEHVQVRVDGIEARGLDERNQLVVDRTPRIGYLARSTPELILQRLRNEAEGDRADLYAAMLDRLGAG